MVTVEQIEQALPLEYRKGASAIIKNLGPLYQDDGSFKEMCTLAGHMLEALEEIARLPDVESDAAALIAERALNKVLLSSEATLHKLGRKQ